MDRDARPLGVARANERAAIPRHPHRRPEERGGGGRAETNEHARGQRGQLRFDPWPARRDLAAARPFVNAALPARRPLEVLDRIRHPAAVAGNPRVGEGAIEKPPCRSDERKSGAILLVAGLLADQDDVRICGPAAPHGLGRPRVQGTRSAAPRSGAERGQIHGRRRLGTHRGTTGRHRDRPEQVTCPVV